MSECECNITAKLKQERDELAAQVEVMRADRQKIFVIAVECEEDFERIKPSSIIDLCRPTITGPDALREIQARTLDGAARHKELFTVRDYLLEFAAAIRKGE